MHVGQSTTRQIIQAPQIFRPHQAEIVGYGPRIELTRFDGSNPKLWQTHCKDHFRFWNTPQQQWISFASAQFEGTAARWSESVHHRARQVNWAKFCALLQSRLGRNKHQNLLRQMFKIHQSGSVEDYVERFSELYDQLTAYEAQPNMVHYVTRFMEELALSNRKNTI